MPTALVRNGRVVTASESYEADLYVDAGKVALIGQGLSLPADTVLDASGCLVLPGGIDAHTHLDMPAGELTSADDFETGTRAAAVGGTTTVIDFATPSPASRSRLETWRKAEGKAAIDYGFHMALRGVGDATLAEMARLTRDEGVTSFKLYLAYPGVLQVDDAAFFRALLGARDCGALPLVHAENGGVIDVLVKRALARGETAPRHHALTRPPETEAEATARAISMATMAGAPLYVVHLTCAAALAHVTTARDRGLPVHAETCPQYLFLSRADYDRPGFEGAQYVMSPPLREAADQEALWRGLAGGDLQVVATDHCPFTLTDKARGKDDFSKIPNGAPGIETRMTLLWDGGVRAGRIDAQRFVELTAAGPARIFGLWPRKGTIAVGSDADLVVWDPERRAPAETLTCAWTTPLRGTGRPRRTRGRDVAGRGRRRPRGVEGPARSRAVPEAAARHRTPRLSRRPRSHRIGRNLRIPRDRVGPGPSG
jgi:dihydropyrimidinase